MYFLESAKILNKMILISSLSKLFLTNPIFCRFLLDYNACLPQGAHKGVQAWRTLRTAEGVQWPRSAAGSEGALHPAAGEQGG